MEQQDKINKLKQQLEGFLTQLDNLDPSKTSVEDIDELINMIEKIENSLS